MRRRLPSRFALAAALLAALAVSGCSPGSLRDSSADRASASRGGSAPSAGDPTTQRSSAPPATVLPAVPSALYRQKLSWRPCGGGFRCASLQVPLDYARPAAERIRLALVQLPAGGPGARVGSLVVNPGGPGASGVDYARAARTAFSPALRARFDIVGFDPRGSARSAPVDCVDDRALDAYVGLDPSPDTPAERAAGVSANRDLARGCAARSGRLLAHVATVDSARDLDLLRAALGDAKLTYYGASYGTLLGARYAELFPARVRALALDGALDPQQTGAQLARAQVVGFERALGAFLSDCVRRRCRLGRDRAEALRRIDGLIARAEARPLPAAGGRRADEAAVVLGLAAGLYSPRAWPVLQLALERGLSGDGSLLVELSDALTDRRPDGTYSNRLEAATAINCIDRPEDRDVSAYDRAAEEYAAISPRFGPLAAYGALSCAFWPVPPVDGPHRITARGSPPILVIGTTRDPATPYEDAVALADQLASGALLTREGDGHTAYRSGSACIDGAVDRYLLTGRPPADGTRCR